MKKLFLIKFAICFSLILVSFAFAKDYGKKPYLATHLTYPEFMEAKTIFEVDKIEGYTFRRLEFKKPYQEGVADKMYPDYPTMTHYFDHPFIYDKTPVVDGRVIGKHAIATLPDLAFSPIAGTYSSAQMVEIISPIDNVRIYYTVDERIPTEHSILYKTSFSISSTATLKARAYKHGWIESAIKTGEYIIEEGWASHFGPTKWTQTVGTWDGSKYVSAQGGTGGMLQRIALEPPLGFWAVGYRPTKCRITCSITLLGDYAVDVEDNDEVYVFLTTTNYVSLTELDVNDTQTSDLFYINIKHVSGDVPNTTVFNVTNIEFFE